MRNSQALVQFLSEENPGGCKAFSMDIEDLYCSLPHEGLLKCAKNCINEQVQVTVFTGKFCVCTEAFLQILSMYLRSTMVGGMEEGVYAQRSGICIRSKVAPILSELKLGKVDKRLEDALGKCNIKVFRYVDDYLIFRSGNDLESVVTSVSEQFELNGGWFSFAKEFAPE